MPEEEYTWLPRERDPHFEEMSALVDVFIELGVDKVRLTGGEPLLRRDLSRLVPPARGQARHPRPGAHHQRRPPRRAARRAPRGRAPPGHGEPRHPAPRAVHAPSRAATTHRPGAGGHRRRAGRRASRARSSTPWSCAASTTTSWRICIEFGRTVPAEVRFIEYMDVGGATRWSMDQVVSGPRCWSASGAATGRIEPLSSRTARRRPNATACPTARCSASSRRPPSRSARSCDRSRLTADGMWYRASTPRRARTSRTPLRRGRVARGAGGPHRGRVEAARRPRGRGAAGPATAGGPSCRSASCGGTRTWRCTRGEDSVSCTRRADAPGPAPRRDARRRGARGQRQVLTAACSCSFTSSAACADPKPLVGGAGGEPGSRPCSTQDLNDPRGMGLLAMHEDPAFFVDAAPRAAERGAVRRARPTDPSCTMLGRTYASGFEPDLEDWLLRRPRRTVLNPAWPWAVWYPLRRVGRIRAAVAAGAGRHPAEHSVLGRAYGDADLAHDVRLACHGLDVARQRLRHRPRGPRAPPALPPRPGHAEDRPDVAVHPDSRALLRRPRPLAEPAPLTRRPAPRTAYRRDAITGAPSGSPRWHRCGAGASARAGIKTSQTSL